MYHKYFKHENIRGDSREKRLPETASRTLVGLLYTPGEGTQLFFGGCVPRRFQNVGSRERIFLEKWGFRELKFRKIWV